MPAQLVEERLAEEERKKYRLKNGKEIEGSLGMAALNSLEALLAQRPRLFQSLLAIAEGRSGEVPAEDIDLLKDGGYLRAKSGEVCPHLPDVLLSAYQVTLEGPVLVNPFQFETAEQAREVEKGEKGKLDWLVRELRRGDGRDEPPTRR